MMPSFRLFVSFRTRPVWVRSMWVGGVAALLCQCLSAPPTLGAANPYRGLWVGQATLSYVNEVPVPLDADNVPIAPDPTVATPTADSARMRLILHVNGAGQVSLLRDVAILRRGADATAGNGEPVDLKQEPDALNAGGRLVPRESDLSLVTDERMFGDFPSQVATRFASAVFDFGDGRATEAVLEVIDEVARAAASGILGGGNRQTTITAARDAGQGVLDTADVAAAFQSFLQQDLTRAKVDLIATGDGPTLTQAQAAADALLTRSSFFPDPRARAMVDAIVATADAAGADDADRKAAAQTVAATYSDLDDQYHRFLAGAEFGDMIVGAAEAAGGAAVVPLANEASIRLAIDGNTEVRSARTTALNLDTASDYDDQRATAAVETVLTAVLDAAVAALPAPPGTASAVAQAAEEAARLALEVDVARFPAPTEGPTVDYTIFLGSPRLAAVPATAAAAAGAAPDAVRADLSERIHRSGPGGPARTAPEHSIRRLDSRRLVAGRVWSRSWRSALHPCHQDGRFVSPGVSGDGR